MSNLQSRSAHARIFAIIILFALLPAWFFYIGVQYSETITVLKTATVSEMEASLIQKR